MPEFDKSVFDQNMYHNVVTGVTTNPLIQNPDAIDTEFAEDANYVLKRAAELARILIGAHQSAIAIVVEKDWTSVRKYFSLSPKYAEWADYSTPAVGMGIHAWLLDQATPIRLTQAELEAHPAWKGFGTEASKHPPMRGWLAAPLHDRQGVNWGLFQLSDKYDGDFTAEDEQNFIRLAELTSISLEDMWRVRMLKKELAAKSS